MNPGILNSVAIDWVADRYTKPRLLKWVVPATKTEIQVWRGLFLWMEIKPDVVWDFGQATVSSNSPYVVLFIIHPVISVHHLCIIKDFPLSNLCVCMVKTSGFPMILKKKHPQQNQYQKIHIKKSTWWIHKSKVCLINIQNPQIKKSNMNVMNPTWILISKYLNSGFYIKKS